MEINFEIRIETKAVEIWKALTIPSYFMDCFPNIEMKIEEDTLFFKLDERNDKAYITERIENKLLCYDYFVENSDYSIPIQFLIEESFHDCKLKISGRKFQTVNKYRETSIDWQSSLVRIKRYLENKK